MRAWARENGCPWDELTCANAASKGHLEILKWARENGCPWDELTCEYAAQNWEVLKWVKENGRPWNKLPCSYVLKNGIECLKRIYHIFTKRKWLFLG